MLTIMKTMTHIRCTRNIFGAALENPRSTHVCTQTKTDLVRTLGQRHENKPLTQIHVQEKKKAMSKNV